MVEPQRQCAVCRKRGEKTSLFRLVRMRDGRTVFDPRYKANGRGMYVCKKAECIHAAKEKNLAETVLKVSVPSSVYLEMAEAFRRQESADLETLLGFAVRAGKALLGVTSVLQATQKGSVHLILMEEQAGPQTQKRISRISRSTSTPMILYRGNRTFENLVGKTNCKCVGITDRQFADSMVKAYRG